VLTELCGQIREREQGTMYAGRFTTYEDCARNLHITLSCSHREELETQLEPVLSLMGHVGRLVAEQLEHRYRTLLSQLEIAPSTVADFYPRRAETLDEVEITREIGCAVDKAWLSVLSETVDRDDTISLNESHFERVQEALPLQQSWVGPRICQLQSPDMMVAARSWQDVARNELRYVIGEVHPGTHGVAQPVAEPFCPQSAAVRTHVEKLWPHGLLVLVDPPAGYQRSHLNWPQCDKVYEVTIGAADSRFPRSHQFRAAEVELHADASGLWATVPDTGLRTHIIDLMPTAYHRIMFRLASRVLCGCINARVEYGRVILKRRTWAILSATLPKLTRVAESADAFASMTRWRLEQGLPRRCFARVPTETKPFYVDFANPLAADLLLATVQRAPTFVLSELLPGPRDLWLKDERGFCCAEFRMTFSTD
jgi:hypothetical protein